MTDNAMLIGDPQVQIRDAQIADADAVATIYAHYVCHSTASFEQHPPDTVAIAQRMRTITEQNLPYLVAESNRRITGYAYASPWRSRAAYRYSVEDSVYVAADMQRRGIGSALLVALIARCEPIGIRQMVAVIGDSSSIPSIELHRRLGFRQIGALRDIGYKFDRWLDTVLMQRAL